MRKFGRFCLDNALNGEISLAKDIIFTKIGIANETIPSETTTYDRSSPGKNSPRGKIHLGEKFLFVSWVSWKKLIFTEIPVPLLDFLTEIDTPFSDTSRGRDLPSRPP